MSIISWITHNGDNVVDQTGFDIQFKNTVVQITSAWGVSASVTMNTPMEASINVSWDVDATAKMLYYLSSSIRTSWEISPTASRGYSEWTIIMLRYIGSRTV